MYTIGCKTSIHQALARLSRFKRTEEMRPVLEKSMKAVVQILRDRTPVSKDYPGAGKLKKGWRGKVVDTHDDKLHIVVENVDPRAKKLTRLLAKGAKKHLILPKRANYLRFIGRRDGALVFARVVHHPGFRVPKKYAQIPELITAECADLRKRIREKLREMAGVK